MWHVSVTNIKYFHTRVKLILLYIFLLRINDMNADWMHITPIVRSRMKQFQSFALPRSVQSRKANHRGIEIWKNGEKKGECTMRKRAWAPWWMHLQTNTNRFEKLKYFEWESRIKKHRNYHEFHFDSRSLSHTHTHHHHHLPSQESSQKETSIKHRDRSIR